MGFTKLGFERIFTGGKGQVTNEEVRAEEAKHGANINDNQARSMANEKTNKDHELYVSERTVEEVKAMRPDLASDLSEVVESAEVFTGGKVTLYEFAVDVPEDGVQPTHYDEWGNPQYPPAESTKQPAICVAFESRHAQMREIFQSATPPLNYPAGTLAIAKAGRDVPYRWEASGGKALDTFVNTLHLVIANCQERQIREGREITMPGGRSGLLPPGMR